jgi:hypothetical protein
MEFDLTKNISKNTINYNYHETTFYKNQFEKTLHNGGYIKIPYPSILNKPNIYSNIFDSDYVTTNLYISNKIHKIKNIHFDGELIIEHKSLTNNKLRLYSCFLLKSNAILQTDIDLLLQGNKDITMNLNQYIKPSQAIYYINATEHVIIFTTPISIKTKLEDYKSIELINPNSATYEIVNMKYNLGNLIEGIDETVIATYCQPIDEEDPTIKDTAAVLIPSDGQVAINKAETSQITTALNFFGFFILVLFVVLVVPSLYQNFIIDLILDNKKDPPGFSPQQLLNRTSGADIYIGVILFGFSFSLINEGIVNNNTMHTIIGFYVFIFFLASFIVLQYQRIFDKTNFLKKFTQDQGLLATLQDFSPSPDIGGFLFDNLTQMFVKKEIDPTTGKTRLQFQFNFAIVVIIFTILYLILKKYKLDKSTSKSIFLSLPMYMFLLAIYIAVYIKHIREKNLD